MTRHLLEAAVFIFEASAPSVPCAKLDQQQAAYLPPPDGDELGRQTSPSEGPATSFVGTRVL